MVEAVLRITKDVSKEPANRMIAIDHSPRSPRMEAPKKPPMLATELMSAMPPAAATPERNTLGSVQKTGSILIMPDCARHNPAIATSGVGPHATIAHPIAAANAEPAKCQRRSPVLSELIPTNAMATIAHRCGSAVSNPICTLVAPWYCSLINVGK